MSHHRFYPRTIPRIVWRMKTRLKIRIIVSVTITTIVFHGGDDDGSSYACMVMKSTELEYDDEAVWFDDGSKNDSVCGGPVVGLGN